MPQNRDELYRDANNMVMQYAKYAIQFAFLLDGAAATALFTKVGDAYTTAASIFAFGAWCAVVCMGVTYVTQLLIAETWRQDPNNMQIYFWGKWRHCTEAHAERARYAACGFWIAAMVLAFVGVWVALSSQG